MKLLERISIRKKEEPFDRSLISAIQPQGGLRFNESFIRVGSGYMTCIQVYGYPSAVNLFWLQSLTDQDDIIVTMDVKSTKMDDAIRDINRSMDEHSSRVIEDKKAFERHSSASQIRDLSGLFHDILDGEKLKEIRIRMFLTKPTLAQLEEQANQLIQKLRGFNFQATIFLNELEDDFYSLTTPISEQEKVYSRRSGKMIRASSLSAGAFNHFSKLIDPKGFYYGVTNSHGNVVFDMFHVTATRKFFNSVVMGQMGSGKSTLLKKMTLAEVAKGSKVRVFDASGEFQQIAEFCGGKYLSLDGTDGMINPLQIYQTSFDDFLSDEKNEEISYAKHMAKLSGIYAYLVPESQKDEQQELTRMLTAMYRERNILGQQTYAGCTRFQPKEYPTLRDFVAYLKQYIKDREDIPSQTAKEGVRIAIILERTFSTLIDNAGRIFNGHSTLTIQNEDLVIFNISALQSMQGEIFNATVFNILNILWEEMIVNVKYGRGATSQDDANHYLLIIDEAHRLVNSQSSKQAKQFFAGFMREARKYQGGLVLSTHLLTDFIKENETAIDGDMSELFKLTQYKWILKQDNSSLRQYQKVFEQQLTPSEIQQIPNFVVGQCLLSITGDQNVIFRISLGLPEERSLIGTGGR